ncbi:MAG: T9SS type B sorting domain-containing protein, partial [Flavobacterium sp.]
NNNNVLVQVTGAGKYSYNLNTLGTEFQESPFFENVPAGFHIVTVRDENNCGEITKEIAVLGAPPFFSPNGDGYNDTWNIMGANRDINNDLKVEIYDRFGKLITLITPKTNGWDGKYNGENLVASDYWYLVKRSNGNIYKGHFSLIR